MTRRYSSDTDATMETAILGRIMELQDGLNRANQRIAALEELAHGGRIGFCGECGGWIYADGVAVHGEGCSRED